MTGFKYVQRDCVFLEWQLIEGGWAVVVRPIYVMGTLYDRGIGDIQILSTKQRKFWVTSNTLNTIKLWGLDTTERTIEVEVARNHLFNTREDAAKEIARLELTKFVRLQR